MSFDATRLTFDLFRADTPLKISPTARLVLLVLADRANKNLHAWPSVTSISRDTGLGRRTVFRALQLLEEFGLIQRTHRRDLSRQERAQIRIDQVVYRLTYNWCHSGTSYTNWCHSGTRSGVTVAPEPINNQSGAEPTKNQPSAPPLGERRANNLSPAQVSELIEKTLPGIRRNRS